MPFLLICSNNTRKYWCVYYLNILAKTANCFTGGHISRRWRYTCSKFPLCSWEIWWLQPFSANLVHWKRYQGSIARSAIDPVPQKGIPQFSRWDFCLSCNLSSFLAFLQHITMMYGICYTPSSSHRSFFKSTFDLFLKVIIERQLLEVIKHSCINYCQAKTFALMFPH